VSLNACTYVAVCRIVFQCVGVSILCKCVCMQMCCSVLQHVAVCCSMVTFESCVRFNDCACIAARCSVLHCVALCCCVVTFESLLAVCCRVLQFVAIGWYMNAMST